MTWFYPGQPEAGFMLECKGTVAEAIARGPEGNIDIAISNAAALLAHAL